MTASQRGESRIQIVARLCFDAIPKGRRYAPFPGKPFTLFLELLRVSSPFQGRGRAGKPLNSSAVLACLFRIGQA
jgi:hypothetical protein